MLLLGVGNAGSRNIEVNYRGSRQRFSFATVGKPKCAYELSDKLGIPIAHYCKIKLLEDSGLLFCAERRLTQEGKRIGFYKSNIKNAQILFERNKIRAKIEMIDGTTQDASYDIDVAAFLETVKQPA